MRIANFVNALLLGILAYSNAYPATPSKVTPEKVFLGYVAGMPSEINFDLYTHLAHAFLVAEKDGSLQSGDAVPNRELTRDAHDEGVKVLISLGGWGYDENFAAMSLDAEAEDRYVQAVMDIVAKYDYDGIDLDWEYPDTNIEIVGFERLSRRFRKLLDELGEKKDRAMVLTMAAASHPRTLGWLSNEFLLETMDWVNIMTYDYTGRWAEFAGHHAPLHSSSEDPKRPALSTESTIKYLLEERHFPPDRLTVGIPLYGKVFAVKKPYASTLNAPRPSKEALTFRQISKLKNTPNWKRFWDDETKNPWLIAQDGSEIICYDDSQSIALKTEWAMKQGLRGVFFWEIAGDRLADGSNPPQEAAKKKLIEKGRR
ncbi:glycoside hydrolase family 18 protein [Bythopirellula polymerisocia]|uniref:chitinase n=1 Tax=Bythopirellula polymerisocia TaxID=2528003 RepID=A0A5C6CZB2_9BACT|nr:glycoside hydrolase family 18 protein [Bythopirellula polymerisocia]TWU29265.1 Chitinase A1 precursor [Bythopirellula polymerisocia]